MPPTTYLDPTNETAMALFARGIEGPVTMLNLLRLRDTADYSLAPELEPQTPLSGREAYDLYVRHTKPLLEASGGELLYLGEGGPYLIGPEGEGWDLVMLVRQSSVEAFMAFASDPQIQAGLGHRTAAVYDSRLLPLVDCETD